MECVKEQKEMLRIILSELEHGDRQRKHTALRQLETFYTMLEVKQ